MAEQQSAGNGDTVADVQETTCCIVGGGPAGLILSLLLARQGVPVTLLEAHKDFDRDFRGDTIHPSTLEVLDQLGLADRLHQFPHGKIRRLTIVTRHGSVVMGDLSRLNTRFPYIMTLPQAQFLDFIAEEAKRYPSFRLVLGANVQRLVEEGGTIRGVRYRGADDQWHEVRATLTVAADGRFSRVRSLAGVAPVKNAPPMDVIWFRLPRRPGDHLEDGTISIDRGHFCVMFPRADEWQVGYVILKGSYQDVRAEGLDSLKRSLLDMVPWLADRTDTLTDWKQLTMLSVESSRVPCWHRPGLLLIGDAAHAMSPVGGVGINYAVQDAVESANILAGPLKKGQVTEQDLAAVQKARTLPTWAIQTFQGLVQKQIVKGALEGGAGFRVPWFVRLVLSLPLLRNIPGRMIGFGIRRVRVKM